MGDCEMGNEGGIEVELDRETQSGRSVADDMENGLDPQRWLAPSSPDYSLEGDEVFTPSGVASQYEPIVSELSRLGVSGMSEAASRRDRFQREAGVTFKVPGTDEPQLFPLDLIPRLVSAAEWEKLTVALEQRARALNAFLNDVYGRREVVHDGIIPSWVIDSAPGMTPVGFLMHHQKIRAQICGMDLVKNSAGEWFVLEDNLRVPSGIGYAMQNRRLMDAVMGGLPRDGGVADVSIAPEMLLQAFRAAAPPESSSSPRIIMLSEGPDGSAWFEHRMLAFEMGIPVALCSDILVEDDRVFLIQGDRRERVDSVYLRIGEQDLLQGRGADGRPLGLGLFAAAHVGGVALANAPGNGAGDDKAVYAYVPAFIEYYLGERPLLANVPTQLCGAEGDLDEVLDRLDELVLKPVDGYGGLGVVIGPHASDAELQLLRSKVVAAPKRWIAQDLVQLSTHPWFEDGKVEPRHIDLRAFVVTSDVTKVAPVALTRAGRRGSMIVNSSQGGGSKDTWLPVQTTVESNSNP